MVDIEERVGTGDVPIEDPARDVRDDIMDAYGVPEMLDKIWFHKTASAVIDATGASDAARASPRARPSRSVWAATACRRWCGCAPGARRAGTTARWPASGPNG